MPPSPAQCAWWSAPSTVKVREQDASISLKLPNGLGQTNESTCQTLMAALMVHFVQLAEEYPDNLTVLEV